MIIIIMPNSLSSLYLFQGLNRVLKENHARKIGKKEATVTADMYVLAGISHSSFGKY